MEPIMEALNFEPWTFLFQVINLLVIIFVLYKLLFRPVTRILEDREQKIHASLDQAEKNRQEAEKLLEKHRTQLKKAGEEAQAIINDASRQAEQQRQDALAQARRQAEEIVERAREEIQEEKRRALAQIKEEAVSLSVLAAGRLLEKNLDDREHRRLADQFIKEAGKIQ